MSRAKTLDLDWRLMLRENRAAKTRLQRATAMPPGARRSVAVKLAELDVAAMQDTFRILSRAKLRAIDDEIATATASGAGGSFEERQD